jgi:hypothetical protein
MPPAPIMAILMTFTDGQISTIKRTDRIRIMIHITLKKRHFNRIGSELRISKQQPQDDRAESQKEILGSTLVPSTLTLAAGIPPFSSCQHSHPSVRHYCHHFFTQVIWWNVSSQVPAQVRGEGGTLTAGAVSRKAGVQKEGRMTHWQPSSTPQKGAALRMWRERSRNLKFNPRFTRMWREIQLNALGWLINQFPSPLVTEDTGSRHIIILSVLRCLKVTARPDRLSGLAFLGYFSSPAPLGQAMSLLPASWASWGPRPVAGLRHVNWIPPALLKLSISFSYQKQNPGEGG